MNNRSTTIGYFIKTQIDFSRANKNRYDKFISKIQTLHENRIIIATGVRQFGFSSAVVDIFDVDKDMIVMPSYMRIKEFNSRLADKHNGKRVEPLYLNAELKKLVTIDDIKSKLITVIGKKIHHDTVVYIDVSVYNLVKYMPNIISLIESLDVMFIGVDPIYVIV